MHSAAHHYAADHSAARHTTLAYESFVDTLGFWHNAAQHMAAWHSRAGHYGRVPSYIARPISDVSTGGWTPSTPGSLFEMINEVEADDDSYIYIHGAGSCEFLLSSIPTPAALRAHALRYRIRCDPGRILTVSFRQGTSTEVAAWVYNPAPATPTTFVSYLTETQIGLITDYSDLRVRLVAS